MRLKNIRYILVMLSIYIHSYGQIDTCCNARTSTRYCTQYCNSILEVNVPYTMQPCVTDVLKINNGEYAVLDERSFSSNESKNCPFYEEMLKNLPTPILGIPNGDSLVEMPFFKSARHFKSSFRYVRNNTSSIVYFGGGTNGLFYKYNKISRKKIDSMDLYHRKRLDTLEYIQKNFINDSVVKFRNNPCYEIPSVYISKKIRCSFTNDLLDSIDLSLGGIKSYRLKFVAIFDNDGSFRKLYFIQGRIDTARFSDSALFLQLVSEKWSRSYSNFKDYPNVGIQSTSFKFGFNHGVGYAIFNRNQRNHFRKNIVLYKNYRSRRLIPHILTGRKHYYMFSSYKIYGNKEDEMDAYSKIEIPNSLKDFFEKYQKYELSFQNISPSIMPSLIKNLKKMRVFPMSIHDYHIYPELARRYDEYKNMREDDPKYRYGYHISFEIEKSPTLNAKNNDNSTSKSILLPYSIYNYYTINIDPPNSLDIDDNY